METPLDTRVVTLSSSLLVPEAVLDALPHPVVVIDPDGELVQGNAQFVALLAAESFDAIRSSGEVARAFSRAASMFGTPAFTALTSPSYTVTLPRFDGRSLAVRLSAHPIHSSHNRYTGAVCILEPLGGCIEDVAPDALITSGDMIARVSPDGVFLAVGPASLEIVGHHPDALVGRDLRELSHPDDRSALDDTIRAATLDPTTTRHVTFRAVHPDETSVWVDASVRASLTHTGETTLTVGIRDATLRVVAERAAEARLERREREAHEYDALRRVAMAVAVESDSEAAMAMVADEVARLLDADVGMVLRFIDAGEAEVMAVGGATSATPGQRITFAPNSVLERMRVLGETVRGHDDALSRLHGDTAPGWTVAAPVRIEDDLWGAAVAMAREGRTICAGTEPRLERFAELVSLGIAVADTRDRLATQALTDPLTGLANHRVFHERLHDEVERSRRYGRPLTLALIDVDHFKRFNDTYGHQAGDHVLVEVARVLSTTARRSELVARVGGEEFAWLFPEASATDAEHAVDRARDVLSRTPVWENERMTFSAGISDRKLACGKDELYRRADAALYWAKEHGRDQNCIYSAAVVDAPDSAERSETRERTRTLGALRSLARAIDAKDTATNQHSVRVAGTAMALAGVLGWPRDRAILLSDAALLHDIGKLGVPDAILLKEGALSPEEYAVIKRHASLGAEITFGVLDTEQCEWIRYHHERWDGSGYPEGLSGEDIPEGARILAVADAWDVMISPRGYGEVYTPEQAMSELHKASGTQFWEPAVAALRRAFENRPEA